MIKIIFESHGTTLDNEANLSSGHFDVALSPRGEEQAKELGARYQNDTFDAIFCANLKRGYQTAEIAFGSRGFKIIQDRRLRECDYGDFTRCPKEKLNSVKANYIETPFPGGESFVQTTEYIKQFLNDLLQHWDGKKIMIVGSRATQYGLEHWLNGVALQEAVTAPWTWQPGWQYVLNHELGGQN